MVLNSAGAASVTLTAQTGESILVKNIHCVPNVAVTEFLTVQIGRQTVGYFHVGTTILNQLPLQTDDVVIPTIIEQLRKKEYDLSYPVGEGETITFSCANAWTRLIVEYEIHGAGDITPDMPNGSQSNEYIFLNYGSNIATIAVIGYYELTGVHNPIEFPNFPFGDNVPAKSTMEILGIGCPDVTRAGATVGTDDLRSTFLRLHKDREVLFDDARVGQLLAGLALGGAANTTTYYGLGVTSLPYGGEGTQHEMITFPEPLLFEAGEELAVEMAFALSAGGGTIAIADLFVCMPIRVKRA